MPKVFDWMPMAFTLRAWFSATSVKHCYFPSKYCEVSNIRRTLVGNKIVDLSDVVGAAPVGAAPTTSSFSTYMASLAWAQKTFKFGDLVLLY